MTTIIRHMTLDMRICELLVAKFCHDMSGPIGAVSNGLDCMNSENVQSKEAALDLVITSSSESVNRLTFYRQAYGYVPYTDEVGFDTVKLLIDNALKSTKARAIVLKESNGDLVEGRIAKLVYNMTILAGTIIMFTGDLKILLGNDSITVTAIASTYKLNEDLKTILCDGSVHSTALSVRNVQVAFTRIVAQDLGYKIKIDQADNAIVFTLKKVR